MNAAALMPARPLGAADDAPYFAAWRERRLVFQRCAACGLHRHPPGPRCARCRSDAVAWSEAPGEAELFSWTTGPENRIVALVLFRALDGVRLVTNLIEAEAGALRLGMPVRLCWAPPGDAPIPVFSPADAAG
jgi:uncharacterized OB-fold protein